MTDVNWLSQQARELHTLFVSLFYGFATILLLLGVILEYFKAPIGGGFGFQQLVARTLIAFVLLAAYPDISNAIADISDGVSAKIGNLNEIKLTLSKVAEYVAPFVWSRTPLRNFLWLAIVYLGFYILYLTVFFFNAAILYVWILLYVFSPLMIAFFILPQTASITKTLFRSLFEISAWKIVWSVLGILLWSTARHNFMNPAHMNFITLITLNIILALSIVLTPIVVRGLINTGITGVSATLAGVSAAALTAPVLGPKGLAAVATAPFALTGKGARFALDKAKSKLFPKPDPKTKKQSKASTNLIPPERITKVPPPTEPPGWMMKKLERERSPRQTTTSRQSPGMAQKSSPIKTTNRSQPVTQNQSIIYARAKATRPMEQLSFMQRRPGSQTQQQKPNPVQDLKPTPPLSRTTTIQANRPVRNPEPPTSSQPPKK